jgi:hypothetical protein
MKVRRCMEHLACCIGVPRAKLQLVHDHVHPREPTQRTARVTHLHACIHSVSAGQLLRIERT